MDKLKEILTNIKTVIGLITTIIALIGWVLYQSDQIGDLTQDVERYKMMYDERFDKFETLLENIDEAVGWNKLYILSYHTPITSQPKLAGSTQ